VILFGILLIFSGFYAQIQKADAIQVENDVRSDLRARDVNHLIDAIPKCVVCSLTLQAMSLPLPGLWYCSRSCANNSMPMVRQIVYSLQSSTKVVRIRIINVYARTYERLMTQYQWRRTHVWCRGARTTR
jgi:hypothetical protein